MKQLISVIFLCFIISNLSSQDVLTTKVDSIFITDNASDIKKIIPEQTKIGRTPLATYFSEQSSSYIHTSGPGLLSTIRIEGLEARHTPINVLGVNLNSPVNGVKDLTLINGILLNNLHIGDRSFSGGGNINGWEFFSAYNTNQNAHVDLSYTKNKKKLEYTASTAIDYNLNRYNYKLGDTESQRENSQLINYTYSEKYRFITKKSLTDLILYVQQSDRDIPNSITSTYDEANQKDKNINIIAQHARSLKNSSLKLSTAYLFEKIDFSSFVVDTSVSRNNAFVLNIEWAKEYKHTQVKLALDNRYDRTSASFFIDHIDRLEQSLGLQFQNTTIPNIILSGDFRSRVLDTQNLFVDYHAKAAYKWRQLSFYTSFRKKNYLPTFNDLYWPSGGNEDLRNELIKTYKLGLLYKPNSSINASVIAYQNTGKNWILWQPNNMGIWTPENINNVHNKGIDLSVIIKDIYKNGMVDIGASFLNSRNVLTDKELIYRPSFKSYMTLSYIKNKVGVRYNISYTSRRFISTDNALQVDAYILHNLSVNYRLSKLGFHLHVKNILNTSYEIIPYYPMPLRNVTFAASLKI